MMPIRASESITGRQNTPWYRRLPPIRWSRTTRATSAPTRSKRVGAQRVGGPRIRAGAGQCRHPARLPPCRLLLACRLLLGEQLLCLALHALGVEGAGPDEALQRGNHDVA